jgi:hypothetical protein
LEEPVGQCYNYGFFIQKICFDCSGRREDSFENAKNAFSPAVLFRGGLFNVLREKRSVGDPGGAHAEEAPRPPAESEAPGAEINWYYSVKKKEAPKRLLLGQPLTFASTIAQSLHLV